MQATKSHRNRKNGASREQWQARKAAANAARPKQSEIESTNGDRLIVRYVRTQ
jgi:hypothetical protein